MFNFENGKTKEDAEKLQAYQKIQQGFHKEVKRRRLGNCKTFDFISSIENGLNAYRITFPIKQYTLNTAKVEIIRREHGKKNKNCSSVAKHHVGCCRTLNHGKVRFLKTFNKVNNNERTRKLYFPLNKLPSI
ncbi:CLUMA_CG015936, isoform A [Clunio marinus]|uniref:CLUMA_CG015936, isoform A n=1 Tax=Clunio marinus TaxID=568069 RepID=A0A1J1IT99_9DIPT|nr:CLUMA_CG015936, isoform A [Clunio marinus]